jgi:glycosyltransferase involved in cell wall biosynthesis
MRVLHVVVSLAAEWGGPPRAVVALARGLAGHGIGSEVYAPAFPETAQPIRAEGVAVRTFPVGRLAGLWKGHSPTLARALEESVGRFDVIHIHELWHHAHFAAYRAARRRGRPYVVTVHGQLQPWALRHRRVRKRIYGMAVQRRILQRAATVHVFSAEEEREVRAFGVEQRVVVVPNGLDVDEIDRYRVMAEPDGWAAWPRGYVVLFLGRLNPGKGIDLLIRAFSTVTRERGGDDVGLVIAGPDEGAYLRELRRLVSESGIEGRVVFTGMLDGEARIAALERADLFVMPSHSEGFSMAVLEAMYCGKPVIVTRQCRFPEVASWDAGAIVEPGADELGAALRRALDDRGGWRQKGDNARRLVRWRYTTTTTAADMACVYRQARQQTLASPMATAARVSRGRR